VGPIAILTGLRRVILVRNFSRRHARTERSLALVVVGTFLVVGTLWIFLTDLLVYSLFTDPTTIGRLETAKGWAFIFVSSVFLYGVIARATARLSRTQATLRSVVEGMPDGVLILGADRRIVDANPAAVRMLCASSRAELVGMDATDFARRFQAAGPDGRLFPPEEFIWQRALNQGGPLSYKAVLHPPGCPELIISATAAPVRSGGDSSVLVVNVMRDVTETEHLDLARDEFFASAAHALKTPVAIIKAHAQILSASVGPRFARSTAAVERQCGRIDRLVQNLLVLSRIRSGTLRLFPSDVDLGPVVTDVVEEMSHASADHAVSAELADDPHVLGDRERLAMVLRNVIESASRTAAPGAPLTVLLLEHDHTAEIGVRYPRPPSPAREPYAEYDDVGVGRHVAKTIVEAHGGDLWEDTGDPAMTTVWIRLPATEEQHAG
jgi:signal transduction histidine kinase